jgi:hypothetical protein
VIAGYGKLDGRRVPLLVDRRLTDSNLRFAPRGPRARAAGYPNGFIVASPVGWAWNAAFNLAKAFRPASVFSMDRWP